MIRPFTLLVLIFVFGCSEPQTASKEVKTKKKPIDNVTDSVIINQVPSKDSLDLYFENPIDFYALKKVTRMLNSGRFNIPKKQFHQLEDDRYIHFDFWAYEFDTRNRNDGAGRSLCFRTLKPFSTPKERYYDTDNEIIVGIKSRVSYSALGASNFVSNDITDIESKFGKAHLDTNNCMVYFRNKKCLILHITENEKIDWFKYLWLNSDVFTNEDYQQGLLSW